MKKIFVFVLLLFLFPIVTEAKDKVTLSKCVDGDTARFILKDEEIKVRFLGINAPEIASSTKEAEPYGNKSKDYVCNRLKKAEKIELEYEPNTDKKDKYDRYLAYVFVDDKLLEVDILKKGYAEVKYADKDFKYYNELIKAEEKAKKNKAGIYSEEDEDEDDFFASIAKLFKTKVKKVFSDIFDEIFN